jgi:(p)ppGpp synthase/HD superfamily hydrolase
MSGNQAGSSKGDGLYKYNPAVEQIRTSFNQNFEVAQLKAEVSLLKEELEASQLAIANLHQQNQALKQKVLTPKKRDRVLAALGVGNQSPLYKRVQALLEQWL